MRHCTQLVAALACEQTSIWARRTWFLPCAQNRAQKSLSASGRELRLRAWSLPFALLSPRPPCPPSRSRFPITPCEDKHQ